MVISYFADSRKSVVHSLRDVKIVPVDDFKLIESQLFAGAVRCILNDETKRLKLATDRLMQIDYHIALFCYDIVSQSLS